MGWSPSRAQRFSRAFVLTAWHSDAQDDGPGSGQGLALSSNWTIKEKWMPFVRVGVSDGEAAIMESQPSVGMAYTFGRYRNQIGTAVSYQNPAFADLSNQTTLETYVRWQVTKSLAISPNIQFYWNPSLNPTESKIAMYGFRIRYTP
jgi:porin